MIFEVKKQENKITEGLRTFQKCLLEKKKDEQFLLLMKGHAVTLQILQLQYYTWNFLMMESGKKHFPVLFSGNMTQLMNLWGY